MHCYTPVTNLFLWVLFDDGGDDDDGDDDEVVGVCCSSNNGHRADAEQDLIITPFNFQIAECDFGNRSSRNTLTLKEIGKSQE